jgi:predicted ATPase/DNA-binding SARP family transcriptional activator
MGKESVGKLYPRDGRKGMCPPDRSEGVTRSETSAEKRPEAVRVWLLRGFRVSVGSRTIEEGAWRLRKAAALVKLLALAPSHRLHRERVMDLLWPESGRKAASNNLRRVLHNARRVLDPAAGSRHLASREESLFLCPESGLWIDVEAFEGAAATARRAQDPAAYRAAIDLYAGELLPEDRYEDWTEHKREELRRLYLELLVELAKAYEQRGDLGRAVEALRLAVTQEPTLEEAHVGLMRLYALLGHEGEAFSQYERLREILSKQLRTEPSTATRSLHEDIVSGRFPTTHAQPADPSREAVPDPAKHNLPAPRDSFVGRAREMTEVKRELAMTRLLTLTGAGGSGKTRLALEVARDLVDLYADGVWLVELAHLSEGELVAQAVAGALGVKEQPGQALTDTLIDVSRSKHMLLVLDNCEHLINAVAHLVDVLLDSCPRLRVLATSREMLSVPSEVRWFVPTLSVPDPQGLFSVRELEGSEAVRLFAERSKQRDPAFELTSHNAQAVAGICRRLNGVPLAIELAAARVGTLSVEQISVRLDDSLKLLTGGNRTATPRQQTLRGTMDWSYELLDEPERRLFRRLSVFAGGWSLEAAEAIASGEGVGEGEVLDLLSGLVSKSLLITEDAREGGLRYGMLEPVRQYGQDKLEEAGETEEIGRRHAEFFVVLVEEEPEAGLRGPEQATWLHRLEVEHGNFRTALSWAFEREEAELGLRLSGALGGFWQRQGYWSEGQKWLEAALSQANGSPASIRAKALARAGWLAWEQGDYQQALAWQEESLTLFRGSGDAKGIADSLNDLGWLALHRGDLNRATELLEVSLRRFRELGQSTLEVADTLRALALVASSKGNLIRATALAEEALASCREGGDSAGVAKCLHNLGWITMVRGDHAQATQLLEESFTWYQEAGQRTPSYALIDLGLAALGQGDQERATRVLKEAVALTSQSGGRQNVPTSLAAMAMLAASQERARRTARLWGAAQSLREAITRPVRHDERLVYGRYLAATRVTLDDSIWEEELAEGQTMTLEEAVEYALSEEEPTAPLPFSSEQPSAEEVRTLTRREKEIAALLARGLTNRQ